MKGSVIQCHWERKPSHCLGTHGRENAFMFPQVNLLDAFKMFTHCGFNESVFVSS